MNIFDELNESNFGFFGVQGSGKTSNAIKFFDDIAYMRDIEDYKVLAIDFENPRLSDALKRNFPKLKSHYTILEVCETFIGTPEITPEATKLDPFADFACEITMDWNKSYYRLKNEIIPYINNHLHEYNFLLVDGMFSPIIKRIGEARIKEFTGKNDLNQLDRFRNTDLEIRTYRALRIAARVREVPLICTGKIKDIYEKDDMTKQISRTGKIEFYCSGESAGEMTIQLEFVKPPIKRRESYSNSFKVNCYKASSFGGFCWSDDLVPGSGGEGRSELYDVLLRNKELSLEGGN